MGSDFLLPSLAFELIELDTMTVEKTTVQQQLWLVAPHTDRRAIQRLSEREEREICFILMIWSTH